MPFKWRGWWDLGCGAIGDMAIHLMDPTFWALDLGKASGPVKVTSEAPPANPFSAPKWMHTVLEFGARGKLAPVKVHWYGLTYLAAFAPFMFTARVRFRQPALAS